jgi:hypothetical protein
MTFAEMNYRFLTPLAQTLMIAGIIALCQPWVEILHRYGVTLTLIGLVAFSVLIKLPATPRRDEDAA